MPGSNFVRRLLAVAVAVALTASLAACTSSGSRATATLGAAAATSRAPATAGTPTLSEAEFIARTDAVWASVDAKLSSIPAPSSETDYAAILTDLTVTEDVFHSYMAAVTPLVEESPDRVALKAGWLSVDEKDFAAVEPLLAKMMTALRAKDVAQIAAMSSAIAAVPNHTDQIVAVLKAHNLTGCAKFESDTLGTANA